jgi:hypothetical protein
MENSPRYWPTISACGVGEAGGEEEAGIGAVYGTGGHKGGRHRPAIQKGTYADLDLVEGLAVVDTNDAADHLRHDDHVTEVGLDNLGLLLSGSRERQHVTIRFSNKANSCASAATLRCLLRTPSLHTIIDAIAKRATLRQCSTVTTRTYTLGSLLLGLAELLEESKRLTAHTALELAPRTARDELGELTRRVDGVGKKGKRIGHRMRSVCSSF